MGGIRLGRFFGIPVRINYSFLFLLLIFLFWQGLTGVLLMLVTFASVLVHELGHALVARRLRVPIIGIDLHFFGGAAKMARMPSSPKEEILIAAAGPVVSFAIALFGLLLHLVSGLSAFAYLGAINLILGGFNLLPALPMDGGRIFRAILSRRLGRLRATEISVKVAKGIAIGLGVLGLIKLNFFLVGLAVLLWLMATGELRAARAWSHAEQLSGGWPFGPASRDGVEVLDRHGRPVTGPGPGFQTLTVEERREGGVRRWIVRDSAGEVIFMTEQPLRW
jgi:Zn-dependent protease